ncbi:hypothetical protein Btru_066755 [Bulinus truncatus]|nr:hypothetical protein Btru_066755 [Bulinus truncatus]
MARRQKVRQDYNSLTRELLNKEELFVDPDFPPKLQSLYSDVKSLPMENIQWKRPTDLFERPEFIVDGAKHHDLDQGSLGNCWFIAGAAVLASSHPAEFQRVVPPNQSFDPQTYTGMFRFNFWWYGNWTEVIVDDYLPTDGDQLIYCQNRERQNEFWPCLLEKAYAKLYGSYESLESGFTQDAMVDLTGGISEVIDIKRKDKVPDLYNLLYTSYKMRTLMGASINTPENAPPKVGKLANGLYTGHAYSITGFYQIPYSTGTVNLLRMRNPWGKKEWNGPWSDGSPEMKRLSQDLKNNLLFENKDDGEFWMRYEDFINIFDRIELCHLQPDALIQELEDNTHKYFSRPFTVDLCSILLLFHLPCDWFIQSSTTIDTWWSPANTALANTTLANTTPANTAPANTTLANTSLANTTLANTALAYTALPHRTLANITLANTALANTTLANLTLANTTLANRRLANTKLANTALANTAPANTALTNTSLANTTLANTALANTALANRTIANTTLANTAVANTALANTTLANTALANKTLANIKLANTAPANTTPANTTLANTTPANTAPANTALANTSLANTTLANTALAYTALANRTLANITLANTTLANLTLANTTLANRRLANTTLANTALANTAPANTALANTSLADTTLANTALANTALANTSLANRTRANTALANTALANTALANLTLANTTLANRRLANTTLANTALANTATANTALANTSLANTTLANTAIANTALANTSLANRTWANTALANTTLANRT